MGRESEHLSTDEVEALLQPSPDARFAEAQQHLAACHACRGVMEKQKAAQVRLASLVQSTDDARTHACPPAGVWPNLVAGLLPASETEQKLAHASNCDFCGPLLQQTADTFSDELTMEEEESLARLNTSDAVWQRQFATRLHQHTVDSTGFAEKLGREGRKDSPGRIWAAWDWRWASAVLAGSLMLVASFLWVRHRSGTTDSDEVGRLLAEAYTQNRLMPLRILGAEYGPLRALRGSGADSPQDRPAPLLEAEAMIARKLSASTDDPRLLQLKGRADLIEGTRFEVAIAALEKANRGRPADTSILLDLATAYYQRGDSLNRPIDYAKAIDLLGQVLSKDPRNAIALFNRALLFECMSFYPQAADDWRHYMAVDATSAWAAEARSRLTVLEQKIREHARRSSQPLKNPSDFAADMVRASPGLISEVDSRIERYLTAARQDWLPSAFSPNSADPASKAARAGLQSLARFLAERRGDTWLEELLSSGERDPQFGVAVSLLARGYQASLSGDNDTAAVMATRAEEWFHRSNNRAGLLQARWQRVFAERLGLREQSCFALARTQWKMIANTTYEWLRARSLLDYAECASAVGLKRIAAELSDQDLRLTQNRGFPGLHLRAAALSAEFSVDFGDQARAFQLYRAGIQQYWSGNLDYMSAYDVCTGVDETAEKLRLWFFDAVVIRAALQFLTGDPDVVMRAAEQQRLAHALAMCGDLEGENAILTATIGLLSAAPAGDAVANRLSDVQTELAEIELSQGKFQDARLRLASIAKQVEGTSNADLFVQYYVCYGQALAAEGDYERAMKAFQKAIYFAESTRDGLEDERERLRWAQRSARAYREIVLLTLRRDPAIAFSWWERYKSASLRSIQPDSEASRLDIPPPSSILDAGTAVVSYAVFPQGIAAWVWSLQGVRYRWIAVQSREIEAASLGFASACANPSSSLVLIRKLGRELYEPLVGSIDDLVREYHKLIFEGDGALEQVPLDALVDATGGYLCDRFDISISPGVNYLAASKPLAVFGHRTRILVAGDSVGHPEFSLAGLPDAEIEARAVASRFEFPILLIGREVNLAVLRRQMPKAELFHFSGHALANADESGLVLGRDDNGEGMLLSAYDVRPEIFGRIRLAVLSACSSAHGPEGGFADAQSMARILISNSIPQVVASRWPVNSSTTAAMMEDFYQLLVQGTSTANSLRLAERHLRSKAAFVHPFYWAAFALFGRI